MGELRPAPLFPNTRTYIRAFGMSFSPRNLWLQLVNICVQEIVTEKAGESERTNWMFGIEGEVLISISHQNFTVQLLSSDRQSFSRSPEHVLFWILCTFLISRLRTPFRTPCHFSFAKNRNKLPLPAFGIKRWCET